MRASSPTWRLLRSARTTRLDRPPPHQSSARKRAVMVRRPPHPRPNVRDDRETPLVNEPGTATKIVSIRPTRQGSAPAADWHDGQFADGGHARGEQQELEGYLVKRESAQDRFPDERFHEADLMGAAPSFVIPGCASAGRSAARNPWPDEFQARSCRAPRVTQSCLDRCAAVSKLRRHIG